MPDRVPAAILCGGEGRRLRAVLSDRPKALAGLAGQPFLWHLVNFLESEGVAEMHLMAGVFGEQIEKFAEHLGSLARSIAVHCEPVPLGTAGAVSRCFDSIPGGYLLVVNGDTIFDFPLRAFLKESVSIIERGKARAVVSAARVSGSRFGGVRISDGMVSGFLRPGSSAGNELVEAGFCLIHRSAMDFIAFKPASLSLDLYPLLAERGLLAALPYEGRFLDYGVPEDFEKLEEIFRKSSWRERRRTHE